MEPEAGATPSKRLRLRLQEKGGSGPQHMHGRSKFSLFKKKILVFITKVFTWSFCRHGAYQQAKSWVCVCYIKRFLRKPYLSRAGHASYFLRSPSHVFFFDVSPRCFFDIFPCFIAVLCPASYSFFKRVIKKCRVIKFQLLKLVSTLIHAHSPLPSSGHPLPPFWRKNSPVPLSGHPPPFLLAANLTPHFQWSSSTLPAGGQIHRLLVF